MGQRSDFLLLSEKALTRASYHDVFNHFLITRFNVRSQTGFDNVFPNNQDASLDEAYLKYRFSLFDAYAYPTVSSQSSTNFKWIVLYDVHTPQSCKERIRMYSKWTNFIPVFIKEFDEKTIQNIVNQNMSGNPRYIITTRMDNDDGICRDYIKMIQDNFQEKHGELINFFFGYYVTHPGGKLYLRGRSVNTFASLIEKSDEFHTIYFSEQLPHHKLHNVYKSRGLLRNIMLKDSMPAWLVVFHEGNLANSSDINNGLRQMRNRIQENFDVKLDKNLHKENRILILLDQLLFHIRHQRVVIVILKLIGKLRIIFGKIK